VINKLNHIGILVKNLEDAITRYKSLDLPLRWTEESEFYKAKFAFFECAGVYIELIEPFPGSQAENTLKEKGEGINHICYEVDDIEQAFEDVGKCFTLLDKAPKLGAGDSRVFFIESSEVCGVVTEFAQMSKKHNEEVQ
jgi:methylmalonyl-CoA/ethylmalonyl-CoA epimerase